MTRNQRKSRFWRRMARVFCQNSFWLSVETFSWLDFSRVSARKTYETTMDRLAKMKISVKSSGVSMRTSTSPARTAEKLASMLAAAD